MSFDNLAALEWAISYDIYILHVCIVALNWSLQACAQSCFVQVDWLNIIQQTQHMLWTLWIKETCARLREFAWFQFESDTKFCSERLMIFLYI